MNNEHELKLCGPFDLTDSLGRTWRVASMHIFDEGYGPIDVYVKLTSGDEDERLHEDQKVIAQISARIRSLGYDGPDLRVGAEDLQDHLLIVLEAPEEFTAFAAARGWRNLADDYADDDADQRVAMAEISAAGVYAALMARLRGN